MQIETTQRNIATVDLNSFLCRGRLRRSNLCNRIAYEIAANCAKSFFMGVAAAVILIPLSRSVAFFAQEVGLIQKLGDPASLVKESIAKTGIPLDGDLITNADCPMQEYVKGLNQAPQFSAFHYTLFSLKASMVGVLAINVPIFEEFIFRGLIQDILLKHMLQYIVKKSAPGKERLLNSTTAKVARVMLTAVLFSAAHIRNLSFMTRAAVSKQLVITFILGIGFGALKESQAGLSGSIGAHIITNLVAIAPKLWSC